MPQAVKITANPVSGSINKNAISFNVEGQQRNFGTLDGGNWYSNVLPDDGRWVIISESKGSGNPAFWLTAGSANSDLLTTVNGLPSRFNLTDFTNTGSALDYLVQNKYMVLRSVPEQTDADNVVLYVDGGNESSFPRGGLPVYDLSGKVYDGTLTNGTTWNSNGYWEFDGLDDYIDFGPVNNFGTNSFSVVAWHYLATADAGIDYRNIVAKKDGTGANPGWVLRRNNTDKMYWFVADGVTTNARIEAVASPTDRWVFAAGVVDTLGNTNSLYVGNTLESTTGYSLGSVDAGDNLSIGRWGANTDWMKGKISKVQLYNKALTQDDINQIYFGGPIVTDGLIFNIDASNLVSYENGTTTAYSLTGSSAGTLYNGVGFLPNNGGVLDFDGTNDYIDFGSDLLVPGVSLEGTISELTIDVWVNWDQFTVPGQSHDEIISWWKSGGQPYLDGFLGTTIIGGGSPSNPVIRFGDGWTNTGVTFTSATDVGKWFHIVAIKTSNNAYVYVNGELRATKGSALSWGFNDYPAIGRHPNIGEWLDGQIGNIRLYNRALTAEEVVQNYNAHKQKYLF